MKSGLHGSIMMNGENDSDFDSDSLNFADEESKEVQFGRIRKIMNWLRIDMTFRRH